MKVLYIFRSLAVFGGIERVLVDKMNYLVAQFGYDVYMITSDQGTHPVPYQLEKEVHLIDISIQFHKQYQYRGLRRLWDGYRRTRLFEKRLNELLIDIRPDVIICTTTDPVWSIVKVKGRIPLVVEAHNICSRALGVKGPYQQMIAWRLKRSLKKVICLVALTDHDAEDWSKLRIPVKVIPNVVHLNDGEVSNLKSRRVVWVGRFDYQKRPLEIVKIWQQVYLAFPDWSLDIYGDGQQRGELEKVVKNLNMNICVHPPTESVFDVYRNSSILVSTSLFEPFGLVIPEAMSCGLPVVSYDSPYGPSSIITNGQDGFLIKNRSVEDFADRVCQLIENEDLRRQMGQCGIISSQRYRAERIMSMWKNLFDELISQSKKELSAD